MRRIAIIGGNGYMGVHLTSYLCRQGVTCDVYDIQAEPFIANCNYSIIDVSQPDYMECVDLTRYETIYFLAGLSGPERSFDEADKFLSINEFGILNLCKRVAPLGKDAPKIVFPSSRLVYRGGMRVQENSVLEARSVYAATKIACENILTAFHHRYDLPYAVLRICVPYGNLVGSKYSYGTIGFFLKCIREQSPITLYGDGVIRKTYTFISDLCMIADMVGGKDVESGIYNVGGNDYSLKEIATVLVSKFGGSIVSVPWPEAAARVEMGDISLDSSKLDNMIGFKGYKRFEDVVPMYLPLGK